MNVGALCAGSKLVMLGKMLHILALNVVLGKFG
jgi:hypothetical protein